MNTIRTNEQGRLELVVDHLASEIGWQVEDMEEIKFSSKNWVVSPREGEFLPVRLKNPRPVIEKIILLLNRNYEDYTLDELLDGGDLNDIFHIDGFYPKEELLSINCRINNYYIFINTKGEIVVKDDNHFNSNFFIELSDANYSYDINKIYSLQQAYKLFTDVKIEEKIPTEEKTGKVKNTPILKDLMAGLGVIIGGYILHKRRE